MTESDTLDHITLDSDDILTIERFENNYYNHTNKLLQKGGKDTNKLKKNIIRLYNCYVLSQNQNQDELSYKIKRRLNKKLDELKNLEGGGNDFIIYTLTKEIEKYKENDNNELGRILTYNFEEIYKDNSIKILINEIITSLQFKNIIVKNIETIIDLFNTINLCDTKTLINNKDNIINIVQEIIEEILDKLYKYIDKIFDDNEVKKIINDLTSKIPEDAWNKFSYNFTNFFSSFTGGANKIKRRLNNNLEGGIFGNTIRDMIKNILKEKLIIYIGPNNKKLKTILDTNFDLIFTIKKNNSIVILIKEIINSFEFKDIIKDNISDIINLFNLLKNNSFDFNILNNTPHKEKIISIVQQFVEEILINLNEDIIRNIINDGIVTKLIKNVEKEISNDVWNGLYSSFTTFFGYSNYKKEVVKQEHKPRIRKQKKRQSPVAVPVQAQIVEPIPIEETANATANANANANANVSVPNKTGFFSRMFSRSSSSGSSSSSSSSSKSKSKSKK